MTAGARVLAGTIALAALGGCVSPVAMHRAVLEYDRTVSRVETELLLLNVARARHHHPIHFTVISGVAATFEFRVGGGLGGALGDGDALALSLEGSATESPTVSIVPVQGEEFAKRLLAPLDQAKFEFLLHQGVEPAILLRLMARGLLLEAEGGPVLLPNDPGHPESYAEFRRHVLHLSYLNSIQQLHVGPIPMEEGAAEADARIAICNFDPGLLPPAARERLAARARTLARNSVLIDVRPAEAGGDYPLQGQVVLRNFKEILGFLGRSIEEPEFAVAADPRTGPVPRNPAHTLEIRETPERPRDAVFAAEEQELWYSVGRGASAAESSWNHEAFDVLYQLYQLTVTDVAALPMPMITISK